MRMCAFLLFLFFISIQVASAGIFISGEDAKYEASLSAVSISTNPAPIKTIFVSNADASSYRNLSSVNIQTQPSPITEIFVSNADASFSRNLSSVDILTQPSPIKEIFISNADATFDKNLTTVSIPTEPSPIKEIFISNADATLVKNLVPMSQLPTVSISTDKYEYTAGEMMLINITLENPTDEVQPVYFAWRLDLPDYDLQYWIMRKSLYLPPDYKRTFTIPFTLGYYRITFNASWYVALYNTTTLEVISEDTADWQYVSGAKARGKAIPEEIAKEIIKTAEIEEVELPN